MGVEQKGAGVLSPMLPADGALVPGREETDLGRGRWPSSSACMLPFGPGLFLHMWVQDFTQALPQLQRDCGQSQSGCFLSPWASESPYLNNGYISCLRVGS